MHMPGAGKWTATEDDILFCSRTPACTWKARREGPVPAACVSQVLTPVLGDNEAAAAAAAAASTITLVNRRKNQKKNLQVIHAQST